MIDPQVVRRDFPILQRQVRGKPLVYLDNAATTQKPRQVIDAMNHYYEHYNANVHRSIHELGEEATHAWEQAHERAARFINARGIEEVVFTKGTTEGVNLVAYAWGLTNLQAGDEVVTTIMEHHSNFVPWQNVCRRTGATLRVAPLTAQGELDMEAFRSLLTPRTKMVTLTGMSNVLGTITPVREITKLAHAVGALVFVDGAQFVPHTYADVRDLGVDFMAFSGHKMLGPTGVGVLYGKREILENMDPFLYGGEMIRRVTVEETTYNDLPWKFEAGTPNIAEGVGLAAAMDYLDKLGMDNVREYEKHITGYAMKRLAELPEVTIYGPPAERRGGVVSFTYGDIHPHDLASLLNERGVAIRAGNHCAQPLMQQLNVASTARASFYVYNTKEEVDVLVEALQHARKVFAQ
ncbi:MAG TPA: cysteine desulfurase [Candidatus Thermoplasmatota archaeon]|nr:cysteine desulfurase [Candidatus Thermoplasmatota archaeon]